MFFFWLGGRYLSITCFSRSTVQKLEKKLAEYYLSSMQAINFALDRAHFQGRGWLVLFDSRECVHLFNVFVVFFLPFKAITVKSFCLCDCPSVLRLKGSRY